MSGCGCRRILILLMGASLAAALAGCARPAHSEAAAKQAYQVAQAASLHQRFAEAETGFARARDLTTDPDKAAWAQYQLACCYLAQPAKRSKAIPALQRVIHDYPHHYLAARAQDDLDRLERKRPRPAPPVDE